MQSRQQPDQFAILYDVTQTITLDISLHEKLAQIVQASVTLLEADAAVLWMLDTATGEIKLGAAHGLSGKLSERTDMSASEATQRVIEDQHPLLLRALPARVMPDQRTCHNRTIEYAGVPLMLRGRCLGAIEVYTHDTSRAFTATDIERLQMLSAQAAMALDNARLLQTEQDTALRLQQLQKHKNDFIAMIAHELRTPLTSIKGFAQLLLRQNAIAATDEAKRCLSIIEAESNRMIAIINDILDIAKMEAGLLQMSKQPLVLLDVIRTVVDLAAPLLHGRALSLRLPDSLPTVMADEAKIEHVLLNLIGIAVRYSSGDEPIEIGASADDEGVKVWVNERSETFPLDKLEHIFANHRLADNECERRTNWSGLGLYISKNFIEAQGGRIWVEREDNKGTSLVFKLLYQ